MIPKALHLPPSLATFAAILRDMRRYGTEGGGAWRGMLRQVRRCAADLRPVVKAGSPS